MDSRVFRREANASKHFWTGLLNGQRVGTVAALQQGMQEECCGPEPSHHLGAFWLIPKGKVTTAEQQLPIQAHWCFDEGHWVQGTSCSSHPRQG